MESILLVGAGSIGIEYAKVLKALSIPFFVVGRSEKGCQNFKNSYPGIDVISGGIDKYIETVSTLPSKAIVAVNIDQLSQIGQSLIENGVKSILLEKPGGVDLEQIKNLRAKAIKHQTEIFIAYNRRFYASAIQAKKIIETDGGVSSFNFEFTEWTHIIESLETPSIVKENLFLANSSHVVDLAFYLGGYPKELSTYSSGRLSWHSRASKFAGAGITADNAVFSYCANWDAPGRWGVEILTKNNRLILRPLEKLFVMRKGSVQIEEIPIDDSLDKEFKPGFFLQTKAFVEDNGYYLCQLEEQEKIIENYYLKISSYIGLCKI